MELNVKVDEIKFGTNIREITVPEHLKTRIKANHRAFDAVLGTGMVPSTSMMLSGTPGAGKTTICLEIANALTGSNNIVVYNTNEESAYQVAMSSKRLNLRHGFLIGQEGNLPKLLKKINAVSKKNPGKQVILIQDSLQTLDDGHFKSGRITSATSERALKQLTEWTKKKCEGDTYPISIVIGQVTKDGKTSGSNKLRHMVDSLVHLNTVVQSGHPYEGYRRLHIEKNRFGCSGISAFMKMTDRGFMFAGTQDDLADLD